MKRHRRSTAISAPQGQSATRQSKLIGAGPQKTISHDDEFNNASQQVQAPKILHRYINLEQEGKTVEDLVGS